MFEEWIKKSVVLHLLDGHFEERPIFVQSYLRGCYRAGLW